VVNCLFPLTDPLAEAVPTRDELEAVYRRTAYHAELAGTTYDLRIGSVHPQLDAWLSQHGLRTWAFLTAWNPGSQRLGEDENRRRQAALQACVAAAGLPAFPGVGALDDWKEESLLIVGLSQEQAYTWARKFGQAAFLWGEPGRPAALLWT
jgi:hypothetical protein